MGKELLPMLAGVGLAAATGGVGAPSALGAAGGTGAAGAGAAGALGAGNALAAQGAAGLLGSAGAAAAGYGAPMAAGLGASGGAGAMGGLDNAATATFGPNNEFTGQTIASELTANPYTGGFDNLGGLDRIGQRVSGFLDDGGMDTLGKFKNALGGQQEQPQQAQNTEVSGGSVAQQPQEQGAMPFVYGQPQIQLTDEQKRRLLAQGLL
jgi:hypothetical protein